MGMIAQARGVVAGACYQEGKQAVQERKTYYLSRGDHRLVLPLDQTNLWEPGY